MTTLPAAGAAKANLGNIMRPSFLFFLLLSFGVPTFASDDAQALEEVSVIPWTGHPDWGTWTVVTPPAIGESRLRVAIMGCVSKPGVYYLKEGTSIEAAIEEAGGRTRLAYKNEVSVCNNLHKEWMKITSRKEFIGSEPTVLRRITIREDDVISISMEM